MSGIVFYFQEYDLDVFSGRPVDLDAWRYAAKAGGIEKMVCVNQTNENLMAGMNFEVISDLMVWVEEHKNERMVAIDTEWTCGEGAIPLQKMDHSLVDWYIFGSASGVPAELTCQRVFLPQNGRASLHSVHVASAVMLRRWEELNKVVV